MKIVLNGDAVEVDTGTTVAMVVMASGGRDRGVAVAVDDEVVPRSEWSAFVLGEGRRVEILTAAQGG